mmetsp:Transcript_21515/g.38162  ORF Transcript_21515/g.38162 Transcript_21515/m.38162 type:complete len:263 (+) Transcript_21515:66-854(+)
MGEGEGVERGGFFESLLFRSTRFGRGPDRRVLVKPLLVVVVVVVAMIRHFRRTCCIGSGIASSQTATKSNGPVRVSCLKNLFQLAPPTSSESKSKKRLVLFLGNGPRFQYENPDKIMDILQGKLTNLKAECQDLIGVYGGDTCIAEKPDLGVIMKRVKDAINVPLCAVVGWDELDNHVDFSYRYDIFKDKSSGRELYGGFDENGKPVGGTAVYMSPEWLSHTIAVVAVEPRGRVGSAELSHVKTKYPGVRVIEVKAEPKFKK